MSYWQQYKRHRLGAVALWVLFLFILAGIYAPFLASSKPLFVVYDGKAYFPLFRYLFYSHFFTKELDLFFNLLMFVFPFFLFSVFSQKIKYKGRWIAVLCTLQIFLFSFLVIDPVQDPAANPQLNKERLKALKLKPKLDWEFDLKYMTPYARLNMLVRYKEQKEQHERLLQYSQAPSTLWYEHFQQEKLALEQGEDDVVQFLEKRRSWLESESQKMHFLLMPPLSHFHWEDDAGGSQNLNQSVPWWELTRINRKDLTAALIFGIRISLVVGFLAVGIALAIGVPIGALSGFYGGKVDIIVSRLMEVWEAMPTFFMLLMIVAILQSKSIFIVIAIIGFFGWTGFSRYLRGEFFKQRSLPYVEACASLGYSHPYTIFVHILPNAIPPVLTLLPFAMMGAISSEAGLSFLGLGEENSCSWGVLMDEGRSAFPAESRLLWPPAILLTILLVTIAVIGDALRDTFDPKFHKVYDSEAHHISAASS